MLTSNPALRTVILGTGGTIAGRASTQGDNVGYQAGQVGVGELALAVPALADCPMDVEQVAQVDSKDMDLAVWQRLTARVAHHLARRDVSGVVITHGTDTLEETAYMLQRVLKPSKPVVLTCAMRPATALVPDGPQNMLDAVRVARDARASGVLAVCAGRVHAAHRVNKVHTYQLDAFDSGDAGPLACVEEGQVRWFAPPSCVEESTSAALARALDIWLQAQSMPRVVWITSHADADGLEVRALLAYGSANPEAMPRGVIVAGTGNGTLNHRLEAALCEARALGVQVWRASRCVRGRVIGLQGQSWPDAGDLSPAKARLALALQLMGL